VTVEPWKGVLWFGLFAVVGFLVAWRLSRQLAADRHPKRSTPGQQRLAMYVTVWLDSPRRFSRHANFCAGSRSRTRYSDAMTARRRKTVRVRWLAVALL
jgi:hypothetical protein